MTLTRTTLAMRLMAFGFRFLFRAFARVRTSGLEGLPQAGPLIVVANHTTLVDPPFVAAWLQPALGRPLQFLAKEQLFASALSPVLRMYGAILVKAGGSDVEAYRAAVTVLRGGGVVSVFPEGTRSLDGVMIEPRAGIALIAARTGAPILPIGISGGHRFLPSGRTLPAFGTRLTMRVGRPVHASTLDPTLDRRAATEAATDEIMRRIAALVDADQRGRFGRSGPRRPDRAHRAELRRGGGARAASAAARTRRSSRSSAPSTSPAARMPATRPPSSARSRSPTAAGAVVGAHPSYPDRESFGRRHLDLEPAALEASLVDQIEAVMAAARSAGVVASTREGPRRALQRGGDRRRPGGADRAGRRHGSRAELLVVGPAWIPAPGRRRRGRLRSMAEGFADRAYEPDGSLRSRTLPGAVHTDPALAARQAVELAATGRYATLCVHGDTPGAPAIAAAVRAALAAAGHDVPGGPRRGHEPRPA